MSSAWISQFVRTLPSIHQKEGDNVGELQFLTYDMLLRIYSQEPVAVDNTLERLQKELKNPKRASSSSLFKLERKE